MATASPETPKYAARHIDNAPTMFLMVSTIQPSDFNPRTTFDPAALDELAASLKQHGMLAPLVVRPAPGGRYQIVAGERRWRAAQLAGIDSVPARIVELDDRAALELAIIENLQRADLDPIEEATGLAALRDRIGMKQTAIAAAVRRSQSSVARSLGLLKLPVPVQQRIREGTLSVAHGHILEPFSAFPAYLEALVGEVLAGHWTTKRLAEEKCYVSWPMIQAGIVRHVRRGDALFDTAFCKECPFGAYRAQYADAGYCLHPTHYDELQAAAKAAQREKLIEERAAKGKETETEGLPHIADLSYSSYKDLSSYAPPAGCSKECPCRTLAVARSGSVGAICTDPKRFDKLGQAEQRTKNKAARELVKAQHAEALRRLGALEELGPRETALVVRHALSQYTMGKGKEAAAARQVPGLLPAHPSEGDLAKLTADDQLRYAVDTVLTAGMEMAVESAGKCTDLTWYLDGWRPSAQAEPEPTQKAKKPKGVKAAIVGPCARCGASMELTAEDLADPTNAICGECA